MDVEAQRSAIGTSKRWRHFHSALHLATQRVCNKWTFDDFEDCFPQWCSEEREGAQAMMSALARGMQTQIESTTEELVENYHAPQAIDTLHEAVSLARERYKAGEKPSDAWRIDLQPRAAVRAWTIPVLEEERDRMTAILQAIEDENVELAQKLAQGKEERDSYDLHARKLHDALDEVVDAFSSLNNDGIVKWSLSSLEASGSDII